MRYCLVHPDSRKLVIFFYCKRDLHDWIHSHVFCLSRSSMSRLKLHRVIVKRGLYHPRHFHALYMVGPRICSLREYIVKHKLM